MKTIKNKIYYFLLLSICCLVSSCDKSHEEWEDGDPALAHVYYYCFENGEMFLKEMMSLTK